MPLDSSENPIEEIELFIQPSDQQIVCTAYTLGNILKLSGTDISEEEVKTWAQTIMETRQPLSEEDFKNITKSYNIEIKPMPQPPHENPFPSVEEFIKNFTKHLKEGIIDLTISTHLSKRNRNIPALHSLQLAPEDAEKELSHAVAVRENNNNVEIIDPYAPQNPENFAIQNPEEQLRLAIWLASNYIQSSFNFGKEEKIPLDKEKILTRGKEWWEKYPTVTGWHGQFRTKPKIFIPLNNAHSK